MHSWAGSVQNNLALILTNFLNQPVEGLFFARKHVKWKVKKYMTYFQMVFQKLCQNSVSGWGSLEEFWFLPWASPSGEILRLRHLQGLNDLVQVVQCLAVALQLFVPALQSCLNFEAGNYA